MTGPQLSIAVVRDAVAKQVGETSLREVADEVGMSFSGLRSFLDGGSPHLGTRTKLVRWYYARSARSARVPREERETAIAMLLSYVRDDSKPKEVRERRLQELINRLRSEVE